TFAQRTAFIERHQGAEAGFARRILMSQRFPGHDHRGGAQAKDCVAAISLMPAFDKPDPYLEAARILDDAGNLALADAVLAEAERRFPAREAVGLRRTEFIERHHGPQAALARWILMANRFPGQERAWAKLVRREREAGRLQGAESVLAEGFAKAG